MADSSVLNKLAEDPDFLKLSAAEQKSLLSHAMRSGAPSTTSNNSREETNRNPITGVESKIKLIIPNNNYKNDYDRYLKEVAPSNDSIIDVARPIISGAGATGATALTSVSGPAALGVGAGAYTVIDTLLQKLKEKKDNSFTSSAIGLEPGSMGASLANTAQQAGINKLGEKVITGGARLVKGFNSSNVPELYKFGGTTSQTAAAEGSPLLSRVSKFIEDTFSPYSKKRSQIASAQVADAEAKNIGYKLGHSFVKKELDDPAEMFSMLAKDIPPENIFTPVKFTKIPITRTTTGTTTKSFESPNILTHGRPSPSSPAVRESQIVPSAARTTKVGEEIKLTAEAPKVTTFADTYNQMDLVVKDPVKLQRVLTKGQADGSVSSNLKKDIGSYHFMRMWQNSVTKDPTTGAIKLNPQSLANEFYNPEMQSSLKLLYNSNQKSQIEQFFKNVAHTQDKIVEHPILRLGMNGVAFASNVLMALRGDLTGAAAGTTLQLGANGLGKLLTNPKTARLLVNMAGAEPLGVSEDFAMRTIVNAMNGMSVAIVNADGTETPGTIREGEFRKSQ